MLVLFCGWINFDRLSGGKCVPNLCIHKRLKLINHVYIAIRNLKSISQIEKFGIWREETWSDVIYPGYSNLVLIKIYFICDTWNTNLLLEQNYVIHNYTTMWRLCTRDCVNAGWCVHLSYLFVRWFLFHSFCCSEHRTCLLIFSSGWNKMADV